MSGIHGNHAARAARAALGLAGAFRSPVLDHAFRAARQATTQEWLALRVEEVTTLPVEAQIVSLLATGATLHCLVRQGPEARVISLGPDGMMMREWGTFLHNSYGFCRCGDTLVAASSDKPELHLLDLASGEAQALRLDVSRLGPDVGPLCGVDIWGGNVLVAFQVRERGLLAELPFPAGSGSAIPQPVQSIPVASAVRCFAGRAHLVHFLPVPMLGVYAPGPSSPALAPLGFLPLQGYPVDLAPVQDGFYVSSYGLLAKYAWDGGVQFAVDLERELGLGGCFPAVAFPETGDAGQFYVGCGVGQEIYRVSLAGSTRESGRLR